MPGVVTWPQCLSCVHAAHSQGWLAGRTMKIETAHAHMYDTACGSLRMRFDEHVADSICVMRPGSNDGDTQHGLLQNMLERISSGEPWPQRSHGASADHCLQHHHTLAA